MLRESRTPRPDHIEKVENLGLTFHTVDGRPYWNEAAAYRFTSDEVAVLESVTNELHEMCLAAVERVIQNREYQRFAIPEDAHQVIADCWEADPPAIYGRFDLSYDGENPPKLLEYNADTPTSLLEAAVIQWTGCRTKSRAPISSTRFGRDSPRSGGPFALRTCFRPAWFTLRAWT